jgi:hypothetical protein
MLMLRFALGLALAGAVACSAPNPPPSAEPPVRAAPSATVILTLPDAPGAPVSPAAPAPAESPAAASEPSPIARPPGDVSREQDISALASAPESPATPAPGGPTAAVLPPSARMVVAQTPTPNVVASSPALAGGSAGGPQANFARAIKLVQDARTGAAGARLEERIETALARARGGGSEIEVLGWQAALKGTTDLYQVTFTLRENRQGVRAEWEADLQTGTVRPANPLAEALDSVAAQSPR